MGTRNLTAVVIDGEYKIAQYGQWDGYPSGQGVTILDFLRDSDLDHFAKKVRRCRQVTEEEVNIIESESDWWNTYPQFSRDTCGGILELVNDYEGDEIPVSIRIKFAGDSLFCEWCYVVDFDKKTFEVYEGFNHTPLTVEDRFFFLQDIDKSKADALRYEERKEYYPVKLVHTFSLDNLPEEDEFLNTLCPSKDDD